jgi:hypothetical protein
MPSKKISDSASSDAEKCSSSDTINKTCNEHGSDVLSNGAGYNPDNEKRKRNNIDRTAAVEFR